MDKYATVIADFGEVFNSLNGQLSIYPDGYQGDIDNEERYARYSMLFRDADPIDFDRKVSLSGFLMVRLFFIKGYAGAHGYADADMLDAVLEEKNLTRGTQLGKSTLTQPTVDQDNDTLEWMRYQIPFTIYK